MPINGYHGLVRSGKSYEVVTGPIVDAVISGRRVVTNIDGINNDLIRQHASEKSKRPLDEMGHVIPVRNADVKREDFFPWFDAAQLPQTNTVVQPGDLVAIDEAWRFWPTGESIHPHHMSFFTEHGHFTHPETGVACDLILMLPDLGMLSLTLRRLISFNFQTHKKVSMGLSKVYSVNSWEGYKQTKASHLGTWVRTYNPKLFKLYDSFKGGKNGKMVNIDKRQNVVFTKKRAIYFAFLLLVAIYCVYSLVDFFSQKAKPDRPVQSSAPQAAIAPQAGASASPSRSPPRFSDSYRVVGTMGEGADRWVVVIGTNGRVRLASPSAFQGSGLLMVGEIDGQRVTTFSGPSGSSSGGSVLGGGK